MKVACIKNQLYSSTYGEKVRGDVFEVESKVGRELVANGYVRELTSLEASAIQPSAVEAAPARTSRTR